MDIVAQFRATSLDRLGRIEEAWSSLAQRVATSESEKELFHEVHTLKGEARLVGFADVVLIAQRLEDLLAAARRRKYRVTEDVDVLVTMAIQFIRMLLRKKAGASQGGIDINGFLKQIDDVLAEWPRQSETPDSHSGAPPPAAAGARLSVGARQRLGGAATNIFLELVAAKDRTRLRKAFEMLINELAQLDAVPLMPLARRHALSAKDIAVELGKELDVLIEGPEAKVGIEVLDSIHAALLHTLRNAVDHGIEMPDARAAAGKARRGTIHIRFEVAADSIEVTVQDDGAGIDTDTIRRRAEALGLLSAEDALAAPDSTLYDVAFAPGFSVRESVNTLSGRGIGLDAVRSGIERLGGTISLESERNAGVTVKFQLPQTRRVLEVHRLPSTRLGLSFAVPTTWTIREGRSSNIIDPVELLGLSGERETWVSGTVTHIVLSRDGEEYGVRIGGPVSRAAAVRICPSSPDEALEVVAVGDEQMVLIRPDVFFAGKL
jgi:two-component system chemotaxis sensor kinase CheA